MSEVQKAEPINPQDADNLYSPQKLHDQPRNFLFLQGPHGFFFEELGKRLSSIGYGAYYICVSGGDLIDKPIFHNSTFYFGRRESWATFLLNFIRQKNISEVIIYGDRRFYHTSAIQICKLNNIRVWVFEEGYLRPGYVTIEPQGVNGKSVIPTIYNSLVEKYLNNHDQSIFEEQVDSEDTPLPNPLINRYHTTLRHISGLFFFAPLFPFYVWHRDQGLLYETSSWPLKKLRSIFNKKYNQQEGAKILSGEFPYFVFPLQLSSDYQIKCSSSFRDVTESIENVIYSFAKYAHSKYHLVIKVHPFENSYFNYRLFVNNQAESMGVAQRVHFITDIDSNQLLTNSIGMVVINSTMGIVSLKYNKPTITLGNAIYTGYGLATSAIRNGVFKEEILHKFWNSPTPTNPRYVNLFFNILKKNALVLGNFYTKDGVRQAVANSLKYMGIGGIRNCIIFSKGIRKIPNLHLFLHQVNTKAVVGWGYKRTAVLARKYAKLKKLPYYALEDGFIKSVASTHLGSDMLIYSLVLDYSGIYYNVKSDSSLEQYMLTSKSWFSPQVQERAQGLIKLIIDNRIVKYNIKDQEKISDQYLQLKKRKDVVLVIDQTREDASINQGNGTTATFDTMLQEAIAQFGASNVYVKEHPDVNSGKRKGYYQLEKLKALGVNIITGKFNSIDILQCFSQIFVATSGTGFEALQCGCKVTCFGEPFYSGYGLTQDRQKSAFPKRGAKMNEPATIEMLVAAVYYKYSVFVDPKEHCLITPEEAITQIIAYRDGPELAAAEQEKTDD